MDLVTLPHLHIWFHQKEKQQRETEVVVFSGGYTGTSGSGQTGTTMEFLNIQSGGFSMIWNFIKQRKFSAALVICYSWGCWW